MNIATIAIDSIKVKKRKRKLGDTSSLVESIKERGLLNPITVNKDHSLIAGYHRLEACKSLGWSKISAHIIDLTVLNAELAEIDENLIRNELHWTERDQHLARRKVIYEELYPETRQGNTTARNKVKSDNRILQPAFISDTAGKIGKSRTVVADAIQRANAFDANDLEVLRSANVKQTEATKLAQLDKDDRKEVIEKLANKKAKTVKGAILKIIQDERDQKAQQSEIKPLIVQNSCEKWIAKQALCDLLISDPPYMTDVDDITTFAHTWLPIALSKVKNTGRAYICIGAYPEELRAYLTANYKNMILSQVLVWTYRNTIGPAPAHDYKQNWQAILYFRGVNAPALDCPELNELFSVQDINAPDGRLGDRYHAWQKPDLLANRLIRHSTKAGDIVYDPFAGTGTFLLAATKLGRVAKGCDNSSDMLDIAEKRGCDVKRI